LSGVNFGGASGENINKEKKQNGTRCPPHYILEPPPPWPPKIYAPSPHNGSWRERSAAGFGSPGNKERNFEEISEFQFTPKASWSVSEHRETEKETEKKTVGLGMGERSGFLW